MTAAGLSFAVSPGSAVAGVPLSPAMVVHVEDAQGALVTSATPTVTLNLRNNPGGSTLGGTRTVVAVGGVATFGPLTLDKSGVGYTLMASAPAVGIGLSAAFDVGPAPPSASTSSVLANPTRVLADGVASSTVVVTVRDAFSNPVPGQTVVLSGGTGSLFTQPGPTDGTGLASGSVASSLVQACVVTATVNPSLPLTQTASIDFVACTPTSTKSCYDGALGTAGVGPCVAGQSTCSSVGVWGPCMGQVIPTDEVCANGIDEDCSGLADDPPDVDGDGWNRCEGDCCETISGCGVPADVNPGAMEVPGNSVDDDCNASTSDLIAAPLCSSTALFAGVTPLGAAQALDLCQATTLNPPKPQKTWGLISAQFLLANGTPPSVAVLSDMQNKQAAVLQNYGTVIVPRSGATMLGLSTGTMRDTNDPGFVSPISGTALTSSIVFPGAGPLATYLNAHGGALVSGHCGATTCSVGTGANDSIVLRLVMRVPTNARSFSYDLRYFSSEYHSYQCTIFNDRYLAMLTSGATAIPADHNISFDSLGNAISTNATMMDVCSSNGLVCSVCGNGTADLAGTGMDTVLGGGTSWMTTDAPVVPGEIITLDLMIFDVSDHLLDSNVLLDHFRWNLTTKPVGTHL